MKHWLIWFAVIGLLTSTSCEKTPPIEQDKFQKVLKDLYIADVKASFVDSNKTLSRTKDFQQLSQEYSSVLHHYSLTNEEFVKAFEWYSKNPVLLDSVYEQIIEEMQLSPHKK